VVDCIDNMTAKAHLVATCLSRGIPVVSSMGAAARLDPTQIRVGDLCETEIDPFAKAFRKLLRKHHDIDVQRGEPNRRACRLQRGGAARARTAGL
jgi:tRNA A37 threonylcarbamoyladenosine dehydratase